MLDMRYVGVVICTVVLAAVAASAASAAFPGRNGLLPSSRPVAGE